MTAPDPDALARAVFADRLPLAERFAALLAGDGVAHGLIGSGETARLWDRHLVNSALVSELLPEAARVVDVGSGAGLPGLALACRRADLRIDLVESMQRRIAFLSDAIEALGFTDRVAVAHGRAEALPIVAQVGDSDWVTARAVAPLGQLAQWCLPLLRTDGRLLALKGERAEDEIRADATMIRRAGGVVEGVVWCGADLTPSPVRVVVVRRR